MRKIIRDLLKDKLIKNNLKISTKKTDENTLKEIKAIKKEFKNNLY